MKKTIDGKGRERMKRYNSTAGKEAQKRYREKKRLEKPPKPPKSQICECGKPVFCKGLCSPCYHKKRFEKRLASKQICECGKPVYVIATGLCLSCYQRQTYRTRNPIKPKTPKTPKSRVAKLALLTGLSETAVRYRINHGLNVLAGKKYKVARGCAVRDMENDIDKSYWGDSEKTELLNQVRNSSDKFNNCLFYFEDELDESLTLADAEYFNNYGSHSQYEQRNIVTDVTDDKKRKPEWEERVKPEWKERVKPYDEWRKAMIAKQEDNRKAEWKEREVEWEEQKRKQEYVLKEQFYASPIAQFKPLMRNALETFLGNRYISQIGICLIYGNLSYSYLINWCFIKKYDFFNDIRFINNKYMFEHYISAYIKFAAEKHRCKTDDINIYASFENYDKVAIHLYIKDNTGKQIFIKSLT